MKIQAIVLDFDASFADDQGVADDPRTWAAVRRLREAGVRVVLNTGRDLPYLVGPTGVVCWERLALFDMVIAEDGAVAWDPAQNRVHLLGEPISPLFLDALRATHRHPDPERRIDPAQLWPGLASLGMMRDKLHVATDVLRRKNAYLVRKGIAPISVQPILNNASVTWVQPGIDKGTGMLWALDRLGVDPRRTVALGDGENDIAFLRLAGVAAPVANAIPELRALPNAVRVRGKAAAGFREVARRILSGEFDGRPSATEPALAV